MKFSITDFFSKCDQIRRKLRIWSHLLKKSLIENFIFYAVAVVFKIRTPTEKPSCVSAKQKWSRLREHEVEAEYQNYITNHSTEDVHQTFANRHEKTLKIVYSTGWIFFCKTKDGRVSLNKIWWWNHAERCRKRERSYVEAVETRRTQVRIEKS